MINRFAFTLSVVASAALGTASAALGGPTLDAVKTLEPEFEKLFGKELLTAVRSTP